MYLNLHIRPATIGINAYQDSKQYSSDCSELGNNLESIDHDSYAVVDTENTIKKIPMER